MYPLSLVSPTYENNNAMSIHRLRGMSRWCTEYVLCVRVYAALGNPTWRSTSSSAPQDCGEAVDILYSCIINPAFLRGYGAANW